MRWEPYIFIKGECATSEVWKDIGSINRSFLFIQGAGFDPRMNDSIKVFKKSSPSSKVKCLIIEFDEGENSPSWNNADMVSNNISELQTVLGDGYYQKEKIAMWSEGTLNKRRTSSLNAAYLFKSFEDIEEYSDIIVDISSMPRSVYFSLIGKLLFLIDSDESKVINLFITVSEDVVLDSNIVDEGLDEAPNFIFGFDGGVELESNSDKPLIWIPVLGENKGSHLDRVFLNFHSMPDEICPIIPFPSVNPRRGDEIVAEYRERLFDNFLVGEQNILYASEQNPFELYRIISKTLKDYNTSLEVLGGCKAVVTPLSSKLISLGALLASYELNIEGYGIGVNNIEPQGYRIIDKNTLTNGNKSRDLYTLWLTGDPYEKQ
jgi:hypothetical protein